jgi:putative copper export protein
MPPGAKGTTGWLHLAADILHILTAALWIDGMACLLLSLRRYYKSCHHRKVGAY